MRCFFPSKGQLNILSFGAIVVVSVCHDLSEFRPWRCAASRIPQVMAMRSMNPPNPYKILINAAEFLGFLHFAHGWKYFFFPYSAWSIEYWIYYYLINILDIFNCVSIRCTFLLFHYHYILFYIYIYILLLMWGNVGITIIDHPPNHHR